MTRRTSDTPPSPMERQRRADLDGLSGSSADPDSAQYYAVALLNSVMNTSSDGLITADSNGITTRFNPVCQSIFGYSSREVLGKPVSNLLIEHDARELDEYFEKVKYRDPRSTLVSVRVVSGLTKSGEKLDIELSFGNVIAVDGGISYVISLRDVSRKGEVRRKLHDTESQPKAAQDEVAVLNQRLAASIADFKDVSYLVSHDLRAPVVNVVGFGAELERLMTKLRDDEAVKQTSDESATAHDLLQKQIPEVLQFMSMSAEKAQQRFDAVVRLSRLGSGEFEPRNVELEPLVDDVIRAYIAPEYHEAFSRVLGSAPQMHVDRRALVTILKNVFENALEAAHAQRPLRIQVGAEWDERFITILVQDNGIGIDPQDSERIFKMFQSLGKKSPGQGCGLSYCRRLITRLGGSIWCESQSGDGALFHIRLPIAQEAEPTLDDSAKASDKTLH